ncbi:MAG: TlpA disulfide reductase family protein [Myxococcota bacterium]|nr:TlpA disulfide reductase family protein [Myxococcota bacterium]
MRLILMGLVLFGCAPRLYTDSVEETGEEETWVAPTNSWTSNSPPKGLQAEGADEGQVPPDFRMVDQFGEEVSLWQFYGKWVVIDFSTLWCAPCQELAALSGETHEMYEERGLEYLSIISQNLYYEPPSLEEVQAWAETFEMHTPVLADDFEWTGNFVKGASGFPRLVIVGPDMRIVESEVRPNNDAGLRETLDELL